LDVLLWCIKLWGIDSCLCCGVAFTNKLVDKKLLVRSALVSVPAKQHKLPFASSVRKDTNLGD